MVEVVEEKGFQQSATSGKEDLTGGDKVALPPLEKGKGVERMLIPWSTEQRPWCDAVASLASSYTPSMGGGGTSLIGNLAEGPGHRQEQKHAPSHRSFLSPPCLWGLPAYRQLCSLSRSL